MCLAKLFRALQSVSFSAEWHRQSSAQISLLLSYNDAANTVAFRNLIYFSLLCSILNFYG